MNELLVEAGVPEAPRPALGTWLDLVKTWNARIDLTAAKTDRELVASFSGTSMLPSIASGQRVRIRCNPGPIVEGDVIVTTRTAMIVHRAVICAGEVIVTRGDANVLPDEPVRDEHVIGRVEAIEVGDTFVSVPAHRGSIAQRVVRRIIAAVFLRSASMGDRLIRLLLRLRRR